MENFEKCTVAMLGGPCSQHVTGNTSRQNQPQSAIIVHISFQYMWCMYEIWHHFDIPITIYEREDMDWNE